MENEKGELQGSLNLDAENENSKEENEEEFELDDELFDGDGEIGEDENSSDELDPEELAEKNKKLFSRAKRAETELKVLKKKIREVEAKQKQTLQTKSSANPEDTLTVDEVDKRIFLANGGDKEDLEILETIKKGKGVSLAEAQQDELYKLYLEKKEEKKKRQEAQLNASQSGATAKKQKKLSPQQEREEIMKASRELLKKNFG